MAFDSSQLAHREFRETLKQHTRQVVIWAGAGLSRPAGTPTWSKLLKILIVEAEKKAEFADLQESQRIHHLVELGKKEENLWEGFAYLQRALREATFASAVRTAFQDVGHCSPPDVYESLWSLGITSFLTLNLDRFATRGFTKAKPGHGIREFDGINVSQHADVLRSGTPFIANLHGTLENEKSWIFTTNDFESLVKQPGYRTLIESCFASRTVLFMGISADDQAAGGHLARLQKAGINLGSHYWLTHRNDSATIRWADEHNIRQIFYRTDIDSHKEITEFLDDLRKYIPSDSPPNPVTPSIKRERHTNTPQPDVVEKMSANEIRTILNKEAIRILGSNDPGRFDEYSVFWNKYEEAISRAWYISTKEGKNNLFEYELIDTIAKGAFGCVYRARDSFGHDMAIKVLHGNVIEEPQMLECFRRGVDAMKILSKHKVKGMVPYFAAWEIPTCTVMELVEGPNLEQAIEARLLNTWSLIIKISRDLVSIIRTAHQLPERVLHRDIRPANIMLKNYYSNPDEMEVVVLDFDLSWHRDASGSSVNLAKSVNGYLAPEQLDNSQKKLTRNALVDSFGFGMTLYFLSTGEHPRLGHNAHPDWHTYLSKKIGSRKCGDWKSLPRRFSRLIEWTTKECQSERWDMTRACGELDRLAGCLRGAVGCDSCEMLCEEIAARCESMATHYVWDTEKFFALFELRSGFVVRLQPGDLDQRIVAFVEWLHIGDRGYKDVRKFVCKAADKVISQLKGGGWKLAHKDVSFDRCRIEVQVDRAEIINRETLDRVSSALDGAIRTLRFD